MDYRIQFVFGDDFRQDLQKLPPNERLPIEQKLRFFVATPFPLRFAVSLKGMKGHYRFRVGNYRIFFVLEGKTAFLLGVKHRKDAYR